MPSDKTLKKTYKSQLSFHTTEFSEGIGMLQNEDVQALTSNGLTVLQAKVYLTLVTLGQATIKAISKTAGVARQDIYRVTSELQKHGLVEKVIATPNEFKVIPLKDGISILLQRIREERAEAERKVMKLMERYKNNNIKTNLIEKETQFVLVPNKDVSLCIKRAIENAQISVDTITTLSRFRTGMFDFDEKLTEALKRNVKFRFVIDKPEDQKSLPEISKAWTKNPLLKLRYGHHPPLAVIGIFDKQEVIISTSTIMGLGENPVLLSNNPCLLLMAQNYFKMAWSTATEPNLNDVCLKMHFAP
jgi:sugar-specific transcriptional regulator TrmB